MSELCLIEGENAFLGANLALQDAHTIMQKISPFPHALTHTHTLDSLRLCVITVIICDYLPLECLHRRSLQTGLQNAPMGFDYFIYT